MLVIVECKCGFRVVIKTLLHLSPFVSVSFGLFWRVTMSLHLLLFVTCAFG